MNMSQTGYKLRKHIATALRAHSQVIRDALNPAASATSLSWIGMTEYALSLHKQTFIFNPAAGLESVHNIYILISSFMLPGKQPQLGSLAIQAPVHPHVVHVSPSTCHDLSLFKEILREYRRLDDTITMRLNRANATMRDQDRLRDTTDSGIVQEQACLSVWRELVGNWTRRTKLVEYCAYVVDQSLTDQRNAIEGQTEDPAEQRKNQAKMFENEVKRAQVRNELKVESIVRKRAFEAFRSRCQYFTTPTSDPEARKMWDSVAR